MNQRITSTSSKETRPTSCRKQKGFKRFLSIFRRSTRNYLWNILVTVSCKFAKNRQGNCNMFSLCGNKLFWLFCCKFFKYCSGKCGALSPLYGRYQIRERSDVSFKSGRIILYHRRDFVYTVFIFLRSNLLSKITVAKILLRNHAPYTEFNSIGFHL